MGLSCLENKNFLIFFPKKPHSEKFLILFNPASKFFPEKNFWEWDFLALRLKNFLFFLKKNFFLYFKK